MPRLRSLSLSELKVMVWGTLVTVDMLDEEAGYSWHYHPDLARIVVTPYPSVHGVAAHRGDRRIGTRVGDGRPVVLLLSTRFETALKVKFAD